MFLDISNIFNTNFYDSLMNFFLTLLIMSILNIFDEHEIIE